MKRIKKRFTNGAVASEKNIARPIIIRFIASLVLTAALFFVIFVLSATAETEPFILPPDIDINTSPEAVLEANPGAELAPESSALYDLIGIDASQPIEILLLITIIAVAPSILLMMTCFLRIIIVLGFMRNAMQTQQTPPNQILVGLALFLTVFLMWPVFLQINEVAYQPYADGEITTWEAVERAGGPLKTFMLRQTSNNTMSLFLDIAGDTIFVPDTIDTANPVEVDIEDPGINYENYGEQLRFAVVIPAFMVSELSRAFQMGFLIFLPFLIIDIVVASTLMSMGMMMLPPAMISMPFKILMFVLADGWHLLVGSITSSFQPMI
ncbi:MAG: flagellar type III secretion system pore protein FliP [Oscillospiraceae bacterium]|nr:flagellar type III secretion system pore protein FliP [Oscillospiraceae bacterium]